MREPTNADLAKMFHEHADSDERFQVATKATCDNIEATLLRLESGLAELRKDMAEVRECVAPLTEAYNGLLFGRKILVGVASVFLALAAIGGGVIWLINAAIHKQ